MSTTIPALNSVNDILDTDLCLITHSNGESYKISGADINKRNQAVIAPTATPKVLTGAPLKTGNIVRVYWTEAVTAANGTTALSLSYNSVSYTVKVPRNGALENFLPFNLGGGLYEYFQAYTTLELLFDGTNFILLGNPVLISTTNYTYTADGKGIVNSVTANNMKSVTSNAVANTISEKVKYNYCFIPQSSGETKYVKITIEKSNWGFSASDYYGFIMTYYNGYEFYINARNGAAAPIGDHVTAQSLSYINGVYVEIADKITIYIKTEGYRGFFVRFQGYFESMEVSSTAPQGITFYTINYRPNS